ncbi:MAG: sodium:solute symporter [Chitinophagales bacterium]|nr:sodium:solute symporter [Chitinophagales bacterium]
MLSPFIVIGFIGAYFVSLVVISRVTARKGSNEEYFIGNRQSPWYAVAFGMIGDSLSGVTYISVPGTVGSAKFSYLQVAMGYVVGYWVIAGVLLPLYYRMQLTSIYTYLGWRFGKAAQRTGAFFFVLSRLIGAAARLWLAVNVLQLFVLNKIGIPFFANVAIVIGLMLVYTYRGGIKTLVWTDAFQSAFLLLGVILSVGALIRQLDFGLSDAVIKIFNSRYAQIFFLDPKPKSFFLKQFIAGACIAIAMTGLDQNMMQKNLSCRTLPEAQKNIISFSIIVLLVNVLFLALGALLYLFAEAKGIALPAKSDSLFPMIALNHLGSIAALVFVVGLTAATFNSADSVLTTLTTSLYVDFLGLDRKNISEEKKIFYRHTIHITFAVLLFLIIVAFETLNNKAVIDTVLLLAGYTYGPLLGLFAFGILTKLNINDNYVPVVGIIAPLLSFLINYLVNELQPEWLNGYQIGNELLLINGLITCAALWMLSLFNK